MWTLKFFKTPHEQRAWIERNEHRYQINVLFMNNGYAVEYRKLRVIG